MSFRKLILNILTPLNHLGTKIFAREKEQVEYIQIFKRTAVKYWLTQLWMLRSPTISTCELEAQGKLMVLFQSKTLRLENQGNRCQSPGQSKSKHPRTKSADVKGRKWVVHLNQRVKSCLLCLWFYSDLQWIRYTNPHL